MGHETRYLFRDYLHLEVGSRTEDRNVSVYQEFMSYIIIQYIIGFKIV